jgi:hypothetical protein
MLPVAASAWVLSSTFGLETNSETEIHSYTYFGGKRAVVS